MAAHSIKTVQKIQILLNIAWVFFQVRTMSNLLLRVIYFKKIIKFLSLTTEYHLPYDGTA